jgi:hypothetical protein
VPATFVRYQGATGVPAGSTSVTYTPAGVADIPAGNTLVLTVAFGASGATSTPTVSSIGVPPGETAGWTRIASANAPSTSGLRLEIWAIKPTQTWVAGQTVTITFSAATGIAGNGTGLEFAGTRDPATNNYAAAGSSSSAATNSPVTTSVSVNKADLAIAASAITNTASYTVDTVDTSGGSWVNESSSAGSGVSLIIDYKTPTSAGTQTYNPTAHTSGLITSIIVALTSQAADPIRMVV